MGMNIETKNILAQFIMREILELESLPISDQATENFLIKEISNRYFRLHKLYDSECKRDHDEVNGTQDYDIVRWYDTMAEEEVLVLKHKLSGFAPRLKKI